MLYSMMRGGVGDHSTKSQMEKGKREGGKERLLGSGRESGVGSRESGQQLGRFSVGRLAWRVATAGE